VPGPLVHDLPSRIIRVLRSLWTSNQFMVHLETCLHPIEQVTVIPNSHDPSYYIYIQFNVLHTKSPYEKS
jgi:hypothetical protein